MTTHSLWNRCHSAVAHAVLALACLITRSDLDVALESNRFDRLTILSSAALLGCVGLVQCVVWPAFFSTFVPLPVAIALGVLVAGIVFLVDQAFTASDWALTGVLQTARRGWSFWSSLAVRGGIALVLSYVTAEGATLWLFRGAIDQQLAQERTRLNEKVDAEYATRRAELAARLVEPVEKELAARREQRTALQRRFDAAALERDAEARDVSQARLEAERQLEGGLQGYVRGSGPLHRDAVRRQREADLLRATAAAEVRDSRERLDAIDREIGTLAAGVQEQTDRLRTRTLELEAEKRADPRWTPAASDPLLRFRALEAIVANPITGPTARWFRTMMRWLLMTLELSFLFVKVSCAPASVYVVRLIARTKREAAGVNSEFSRAITELHGQRTLRAVRISGAPAATRPEEEQR